VFSLDQFSLLLILLLPATTRDSMRFYYYIQCHFPELIKNCLIDCDTDTDTDTRAYVKLTLRDLVLLKKSNHHSLICLHISYPVNYLSINNRVLSIDQLID